MRRGRRMEGRKQKTVMKGSYDSVWGRGKDESENDKWITSDNWEG